jgi:hypothetical protein
MIKQHQHFELFEKNIIERVVLTPPFKFPVRFQLNILEYIFCTTLNSDPTLSFQINDLPKIA